MLPAPSPPPTPYESSQAHLEDELRRVDQLVRAQVLRWRLTIGSHKPEGLWGMLHVTDAEVETYIASTFQPTMTLLGEVEEALNPYWQTAVSLKAIIQQRCQISHVPLRLNQLQQLFGFDDYEKEILLLCFLAETDGRYRRLFGYLQDDLSRTHPTTELIQQILHPLCADLRKGRAAFLPYGTLQKQQLISLNNNGRSSETLPLQTVRIAPRIVDYLLDEDKVAEKLLPYIKLLFPSASQPLLLAAQQQAHLETTVNWLENQSAGATLFFSGDEGTERLAAGQAVAATQGLPLLAVDVPNLLSSELDWSHFVALVQREARLQQAAVLWHNCDRLINDPQQHSNLHILLKRMNEESGLVFYTTNKRWEPKNGRFHSTSKPSINIEFPRPTYRLRQQIWDQYLPPIVTTQNDRTRTELIQLLANSFQFTAGQIKEAIRSAHLLSLQRTPGANRLTEIEILSGCRQQSNKKIMSLARRIEPRPGLSFDDIILPNPTRRHLEELLMRIQLRSNVYTDFGFETRFSLGKGIIALFAGTSGTGKTLAAELLANKQGVDLYKVDLSAIVSKYVGETEKNLARIFDEAESSNAIIIFDEADSLFGKRGEVKEARDRWANMEVNYLLQRIEEYSGVVILTTNLRQNIDSAFLRRIHFVLEFPFPNVDARFQILKAILPPKLNHPSDQQLRQLAERFPLSGGNLKNVVLDATFRSLGAEQAKVTQRHLVAAIGREYQKLGKPITRGDFGPEFYGWIQDDILN